MSEAGAGSTNPNIPVTSPTTNTEGKIQVESGGGPISFEELEAVTLESKKAKRNENKEKSKDLTTDDAKSSSTKKESEPKPKTAEKSEKPETAEKPTRKTVKAKYADTELDLDEEAAIPVLIDGKEEWVQVKDLRSNYSGKIAYDKKFTELGKTKKEIGTREMKVDELNNKIKAIFEEQDPDLKMYHLAQFAGVDPIQYRQNFLNNNISLLEKWQSMSDDERRAEALAYEAKIQKHRADTLESSFKNEQSQRELKLKVDNLRARHQVSEDEYASRHDQLVAHNRMMTAQYPDYKAEDVTPEKVLETIDKDRLWNAIEARVNEIGLNWDEKTKINNLMKMVEKSYALEFKPQEMAGLVDEMWGSKKTQKTVEAKQKQKEEFMHGKKDVSTAGSAASGSPLLFDDL